MEELTPAQLRKLSRDKLIERVLALTDERSRRIPPQAIPVCPIDKTPLVQRPHYRRFMEDDRFQECENGHVWELHKAP